MISAAEGRRRATLMLLMPLAAADSCHSYATRLIQRWPADADAFADS